MICNGVQTAVKVTRNQVVQSCFSSPTFCRRQALRSPVMFEKKRNELKIIRKSGKFRKKEMKKPKISALNCTK